MSINSQFDHKNVDTVEFSEMYNCTSYASLQCLEVTDARIL